MRFLFMSFLFLNLFVFLPTACAVPLKSPYPTSVGMRVAQLNDLMTSPETLIDKRIYIVPKSPVPSVEEQRMAKALMQAFVQNGWQESDDFFTAPYTASFTIKHKTKPAQGILELSVFQMNTEHQTPLKEVYHASLTGNDVSNLLFYQYASAALSEALKLADGDMSFECYAHPGQNLVICKKK